MILSRRGVGVVASLVVLLMLLAPARVAADAPVIPASVYVPETGFWVDPEFAAWWQDNGGLMTFGYPITRVFYQDGYYRQYFERAIFEHHENETSSWRVQLVRLGAANTIERRKSEPVFQPRPLDAVADHGLSYFTETGHSISPSFQAYWDAHGGLQSFGYPLSDPFWEVAREDGVARLVQYFERARFEYHPEYAGTEYAVLLGHLGREALSARDVPPLAVIPQQDTTTDEHAAPLPPLPAGETSDVSCGFNVAFWSSPEDLERNERYLDMAADAGCLWIRLQFTWRDLQPSAGADIERRIWGYDQIVGAAYARDLHILVDVTHPPDWARPAAPTLPADPDAFAAFLSDLAGHFRGRVDAWQIWNEPNLIDENNGRIDPHGFLALLRVAYPAVKQADPNALVVFPGLAPTSLMYDDWALDDDWYLQALLEINHGEAAQYFDVLGVQAYGAGNSPDTFFPGNLADHPNWVDAPEFYFRHVEQLRAVMVNEGFADKPIWITEMGWPIGRLADVYGYGEWITPQLQAQYLTRAYQIMRLEWHWVDVAIVWHLNAAEYGDVSSAFSGFSVTNSNGSPRPAYSAIRRMVAAWNAEPGQ
jgi:hypothetical protein